MSKCLRGVERAILRGPGRFGTVPRSSPRRKQLKLHARLVVAALRQPEVRLDTHPVEAARELSGLLTTVVDDYACGRLGSMLPEEALKDLTPVKDHTALRETLHLALALAIVGAVGWLGTWFGGTIGVESPWTLIPAAVVAVLVSHGPVRTWTDDGAPAHVVPHACRVRRQDAVSSPASACS
ncbi:hypothetical protein ACFYYB_02525 [Streptomyces sp. NPDC002886]|uniref:hypothetical protein n=1 Tax=Streptomyces sp. NPDC002886 TaxID=3364667 RepID=UPI0036C58BEE